MELIIKDAANIEIKVGDIFYADETSACYILNKISENDYRLSNLKGEGVWTANDTFEGTIFNITVDIQNDRLIHYPSSKYQLSLEAKGS